MKMMGFLLAVLEQIV